MVQSTNLSVGSLRQLVAFHSVNVFLGATCTVVGICLLMVLASSNKMRNSNRLLLTLACADLVNCIAISLMGLDRVNLYQSILDHGMISREERAWTCVVEPWLFFRTIGDLWPPIVQAMIGLEQIMRAFEYPGDLRHRSKRFQWCTVTFVLISSMVGYYIGYTRRDMLVKYHCGRKAAFGKPFSGFIYAHNVIGYVAGLFMNISAYCVATFGKRKNCLLESDLRQLRCCIMVSTLSTILVSIPNSISIMSMVYKSVSDHISKPAVYATCINSGVNLFVYIALNPDFRKRCIFLITREEYHTVSTEDDEDAVAEMPGTISKHQLLNCDMLAV